MKTNSWKQMLINQIYTELSITKETSDKDKIQNFSIEDVFLFTSLGWLFVYGSTQRQKHSWSGESSVSL